MPIRTNGPGKYDDLATEVRTKARAEGVLVLIFGGVHGNGFSAQLSTELLLVVPSVLREAADQIERQITES
jgi:hypothetical protein